MQFTFETADALTIRHNPTTQIAIRAAGWPGNAFLLWLPESVFPLWTNYTPGVARQAFERTPGGGLRWAYNGHPRGMIEAELIPHRDSLQLEVRVRNEGPQPLQEVSVQNCLHFSAAPDFACDDFSRIAIRVAGSWRTLASLGPTCDTPMFYRPDFLGSGRPDRWGGRFRDCNQDLEADHPLIVCLSRDGTRCVGTLSEDYFCLFHNRGYAYLRCIHSAQAPCPVLDPGEEVVFRQRIYFGEGDLAVCLAAVEADIEGDLAGGYRFRS